VSISITESPGWTEALKVSARHLDSGLLSSPQQPNATEGIVTQGIPGGKIALTNSTQKTRTYFFGVRFFFPRFPTFIVSTTAVLFRFLAFDTGMNFPVPASRPTLRFLATMRYVSPVF
jgi:hypothetical protein